MNETLLLILLLFTKHFVVDFPLQNRFQYANKGTYGHPGGLLHASLHGLATMLCFWWYAPLACIWLGLMDAIVHYHVDWAKMNLNSKMGWGPTTHEQFWWLLGLDQFLHALTYVGLVALVTI
jgi:hypothetical protein